MQVPVFTDILSARRVLARYLSPTPLHVYRSLSSQLGFEVHIKHENHQPVGAFKVRGGINLVSRLSQEERRAGVITASTGNHGQSIAYAAELFGVRAIIGMPERSNPDKVASIRALGAEVEFHGKDFDEARLWVEEEARKRGYRYVHSANEPYLIAGVGTIGLEIMEQLPGVKAILVPIGGGSGACGISIAAKTMNPNSRVIGVQSAHARAAYDSWKSRRILASTECSTFAEGMATRQAFELTHRILVEWLDDFVLVTDDELREAIRLIFEHTHNAAEGAGAAALAGAIKLKDQLQGQKVVLDLSGGNITAAMFRAILH